MSDPGHASVYTDVTQVIFYFAIYNENRPSDNPGYFLSVKGYEPGSDSGLSCIQNPRSDLRFWCKRGISFQDQDKGVLGDHQRCK